MLLVVTLPLRTVKGANNKNRWWDLCKIHAKVSIGALYETTEEFASITDATTSQVSVGIQKINPAQKIPLLNGANSMQTATIHTYVCVCVYTHTLMHIYVQDKSLRLRRVGKGFLEKGLPRTVTSQKRRTHRERVPLKRDSQ